MKKILLFVGLGLILLAIVVLVGGGVFIGPIVKTGVEALGPKITQVSIKVDAVDVSLLTSSAQVKGLIVGNPDGYKTSEAIKLGNASVSLDPFSVFSNKILVHSIHVESPEITYDGGFGGNNLSKIMDNVNSVAKSGGSATSNAGANAKNEATNKPAPKIEVDDFLITGAKVHVNLTGITSKEITLPLPDIHLTDLGKDSNGLTATEIIRTVLSHVTSTTIEAVTNSISSSGKVIQDLGKDIGKQAGDNVNTITKGIGGLFGK